MELEPVKTQKVYEQIVDQIKKLITAGHLKPGDRLPSERDLAARLQVSRSSVREAIIALEMMGLLDVRTGEGTFIRSINIESVIAPLAWVFYMEKDTVIELLEVRKTHEVQAVVWAAERATPEDLRELEQYLQIMHQDFQTAQLGEQADHHFHTAITRATHNNVFIRLMNAITDTMERALKTSRIKIYESKDMPLRLYEEHVAIYQAIQQKDVSKARECMLAHLAGVEVNYIDANRGTRGQEPCPRK